MEDLKLLEEIFTKWSKICHHFDNVPCDNCPLESFCGTGIRCDYAQRHVDMLIDTIRQSAELLEEHAETQPVTSEVTIHIRGMNMPADCNNCPFFDDDGDYPTCRVTSHSRGYNWNPRGQRMPDCPLYDTINGRT